MRKELKKIEEERKSFIGTFKRFGMKNGFKGPQKTVLLVDIKDTEKKEVADHLWFNYTKGFEKLGELNEGDVIRFDARVKKYEKGYKGYRDDVFNAPIRTDYKLSHPSKIIKL